MKQRSFLMLLLVGLMSVILAACSGGSDEGSKDKETPEGTEKQPVEGGDLVIAVLSDAQSLDPAGSFFSRTSEYLRNTRNA